MFRERPLIRLFVVATIAVDLVLFVIEGDRGLVMSLKIGAVLGQLAALAIWAVRGSMNRLARMSCLIVATGLLTQLLESHSLNVWLAFNSGYVCWLMLVAAGSDRIRRRLSNAAAESGERWQIPLIEIFGWTVVVAIVSFGIRHMEFSFLAHTGVWGTIATLVVVPTCLTMFVQRDLRELRSRRAAVFVAVNILAAACLGKIESTGEFVIVLQSGYLVLWLTILTLEQIGASVSAIRKAQTEQDNPGEEPRLFDPQD